jgi:hypothetical protein
MKERKSNPSAVPRTMLPPSCSVASMSRSGGTTRDVVAHKIRTDDLRWQIQWNLGDARRNTAYRTEARLGQSEQNAQRLSGQVQELGAISMHQRRESGSETADSAWAAANAASATANSAKEGVNAANERIFAGQF